MSEGRSDGRLMLAAHIMGSHGGQQNFPFGCKASSLIP